MRAIYACRQMLSTPVFPEQLTSVYCIGMSLGENIRRLRLARDWTLDDLSERSGVDRGTISALENRRSRRSEFAPQLARAFGMTVEELQSGMAPPKPLDLAAVPDLTEIPRVRFKLSAGVSGYAVEPEDGNGKPIYFRADWFSLHGYRPERLFAVRVVGTSMEPTLWDGDLVVINTDRVDPRDGVAFALNYEGELVIKRLRRDSGEWLATSDSSDQRRFAPKRCTEDVQIIGEVVYKQSERI